MTLIHKPLHPFTKTWSEVKDLYLEAFPEEECLPFWLLYLQSYRSFVDFQAYYDGEQLAGLTYVLTDNHYAFVFYLAVNSQVRGRGYGSQLLEQLKTKYADKEIVLNIEPLDDKAANAQQREKRLVFYEKNGIYVTEYQLVQGGQAFQVLSQSGQLHPDTLNSLLKRFSLGLISIELSKK
ncbi:GNAT superfamily N-acetyltransferase [Streptococcus rupicaprae]|uniref:GNAT superfamily N-acetyltransferase n=1 Tax=Streptococcus rupicaprae TaxID=759619 RepID=A0ABV2FHR6_9STRE